MSSYDELISSLKVQSNLNRKIWDENNNLHPKIRKALLDVAEAFYKSVDLDNKPPIKDIVFTGSLANFNWSKYSDIDLHLIFDFKTYGDHQDTFEKLFLLAKSRWNDKHDIYIKGFEVEVYAEDEDNPHTATGLYSVLHEKWLKSPEKKEPIFDPLDVKTKASYFVKMYNLVVDKLKEEDYKKSLRKIEYLIDKIKRFRQAGLNDGGEFSVENLTFKTLRRAGVLDKLHTLKTTLVDKSLSVEQT